MAAKEKKCEKLYAFKDSERSPNSKLVGDPDEVALLQFRFTTGEVENIRPSDFPENIVKAATWHGLSQKLGDAYSGKSADEAHAAFVEVRDQLLEGDWITVSEGGGPRVTQLALAYLRAKVKSGVEMTEEEATATVKGWDSDYRKEAAEVPQIAFELAQIRLEAAQALAAKRAEALTGAEGDRLAAL